jgi:hypothetical protein
VKKALLAIVVIVTVFSMASFADACTASGLYRDTVRFDIDQEFPDFREILTEKLPDFTEWEHEESQITAIGTVYRELIGANGGNANGVENFTRSEIELILAGDSCAKDFASHQVFDNMVTGYDHCRVHGEEWEEGYDKIEGRIIADWYNPSEDPDEEPAPVEEPIVPPVETSDYAG